MTDVMGEPVRSWAGALPACGVTLHAAGVGGGVEQAIPAGDSADPAEGPRALDLDVMATAAQFGDCSVPHPGLHVKASGVGVTRVERRREMRRVERREVDRLLEVHPVVHVVQEEPQGPLILLVAAGC